MTPRKHAAAAIHWFNGGQIDWNWSQDAPDDHHGWNLVNEDHRPSFSEFHSFRIHDPYRALKKRQKEGAVIEFKPYWLDTQEWFEIKATDDWHPGHEYRERPQPPAKRKIELNVVVEIVDGEVQGVRMAGLNKGELDD